MTKGLLIAIIALGFASCKSGSKVTSAGQEQNTTGRKKLSCADIHVDMNTPHLDWFEENRSVLNKSGEVLVLPKNYKVFSLDTSQLSMFFSAVQTGNTVVTVLPLPSPADCQLFTVTSNLEKGAKLPPGMVMAVGESNGQKAAFSYYRKDLTAHINWFDIKYEIMTVWVEKSPYAIIYEKMPAPPDPRKNQQNQQPEIIELLYDK
ncbi:MAG TPA: hypothetical protein VIN07_12340 [Flavipsychrobacter sp.]